MPYRLGKMVERKGELFVKQPKVSDWIEYAEMKQEAHELLVSRFLTVTFIAAFICSIVIGFSLALGALMWLVSMVEKVF